MNSITYIGDEIETRLEWAGAVAALKMGHRLPRAKLDDSLVETKDGELLTRAAWIDGLGFGVKSVTIKPSNPVVGRPAVQGAFLLFSGESGEPEVVIDGALLTKWKTVADSLLGAQMLAQPQPKKLAIFGSGAIAEALIEGYCALFPSIEVVSIWARDNTKGAALCRRASVGEAEISFQPKAAAAAFDADMIACATSALEPILHGEWVKPGAHVDLIGAHGPDMREADDALLAQSAIYVDCRETAVMDIGELAIPIRNGIISEDSICGDHYAICGLGFAPDRKRKCTLFKNGGGAHLDLMMAQYFLARLVH